MAIRDREFELSAGKETLATIEARGEFLNIVFDTEPIVAQDLLRLFNTDSLTEFWATESGLVLLNGFSFFWARESTLEGIDLGPLSLPTGIFLTPFHQFQRYCGIETEKLQTCLRDSEEEWAGITPDYNSRGVTEVALRRLLKGWDSLNKENTARTFTQSLSAWARRWHLDAPWCLDFALDCLIDFKVECVDSVAVRKEILNSYAELAHFNRQVADWYRRAWRGASWHLRTSAVFDAIHKLAEIPDIAKFKFSWMHDFNKGRKAAFEVVDQLEPFSMSAAQFASRVEEQLWDKFFEFFGRDIRMLVGHSPSVRDNVRKFSSELQKYVGKCLEEQKKRGEASPKKPRAQGLLWLAEFQVGLKTFTQIAAEHHATPKAVEMAVRTAGKLIELKIRRQKRPGRPRGIPESHTRDRIRRNNK